MAAEPPTRLAGADTPEVDAIVEQLAQADLFGQLLLGRGKAADLSLEGDDHKLDWVDGVEKALAHPEWLVAAETEAEQIVQLGIEHVVWSGMGGSVQTVYALKNMGYLDSGAMTIYPLDSTDPASLNHILLDIAHNMDVPLAAAVAANDQATLGNCLGRVLAKTMMIGVSMGMTSEEPITHLEWFDAMLTQLGVPDAGDHIQVMTLPDSYLDRFARPRGSRMVPIQLDAGNSTPGRMSAPATRVFIRPVALLLVANALRAGTRPEPGELLGRLLRRCQAIYGVSSAVSEAERRQQVREDAFVRLGAYLSREVTERGRNKVLLVLPEEWAGSAPWIEQVVEESLGKDGKGFLVFHGAELQTPDTCGDDAVFLHVPVDGIHCPHGARLDAIRAAGLPVLDLHVPVGDIDGVPRGLSELAGLFANLKKTVVTFAYLQNIVYAGQPAVEAYKKYARDLAEADEPVAMPTRTVHQARFRSLTLYYSSLIDKRLVSPDELVSSGADPEDAVATYAAILEAASGKFRFRYQDFTFNGELTADVRAVLEEARTQLSWGALRMPAKIRTGPSDYHSTEQSETDGPNELISTRLVALEHEPILWGDYSDKFLLAQTRGTWQAMEDANRWIVMITFPKLDADVVGDLRAFFAGVADRVGGG